MENSATSRICAHDQEATSFSCSWTSSMDDLIMFDTTAATTSDDYYNRGIFSSSSFSSLNNYCSPEADGDLDDTATSSPHPSIPAMGELNKKQTNKKMDQMMITEAKKHKEGKGSECEECGEIEDRIEVGFVGRDNKNCSTGLKHIGLCLVPVTMVVNYFG
ncbi:uncharacterized protein LOC111019020 [Momordica charantia]|uniref:Uncharacterized protein LOC111019020 n=1 Tax=Momordica charantia TaxID=3673 RepID=A0A6J1DA11_MOMCH|nr:uncharacterized protein LOC111019020 [Momordica charantia]